MSLLFAEELKENVVKEIQNIVFSQTGVSVSEEIILKEIVSFAGISNVANKIACELVEAHAKQDEKKLNEKDLDKDKTIGKPKGNLNEIYAFSTFLLNGLYDYNGKKIGDIKDVVFNKANKSIVYIIVRTNSLENKHYRAIPWEFIHFNENTNQATTLNIEHNDVSNSPNFDHAGISTVNNAYWQEVSQFFSQFKMPKESTQDIKAKMQADDDSMSNLAYEENLAEKYHASKELN